MRATSRNGRLDRAYIGDNGVTTLACKHLCARSLRWEVDPKQRDLGPTQHGAPPRWTGGDNVDEHNYLVVWAALSAPVCMGLRGAGRLGECMAL